VRCGIPFPASGKTVFICPAGEHSRRLAAFLARAGHDAAGLTGGIAAWRDAGLPLDANLTARRLAETAPALTRPARWPQPVTALAAVSMYRPQSSAGSASRAAPAAHVPRQHRQAAWAAFLAQRGPRPGHWQGP